MLKINHRVLVVGLAVILGISMLALPSSGVSASTTTPVVNAAQNRRLDFTIVNRSGEAIAQIYVGPTGLQDWTDDMEVLKGALLENGESTEITFSPGVREAVWDIRVVYDMDSRAGGDVYVRRIDLSRVRTLTVLQDANGRTTFRYN